MNLWQNVTSGLQALLNQNKNNNLIKASQTTPTKSIVQPKSIISGTAPYEQTFTVSPSGTKTYAPQYTGNGGTPMTQAAWTAAYGGNTNAAGGGGGQVLGASTDTGAPQAPGIPDYTGVSDEELNNAYGGAYSQLNAQEQALRANQPLTEAEIQRQGNEMKSPYDLKQSEGTADLARQETQTRTAEQNAMAQARQLFNELSQYNISRFGAGSSTGGAAMELLGRSTQGQMGNITGTAAENIQKIADAGRSLKDFVFNAKSSIDKQVQGKIDQAQQWFKDQLSQINANRASLESDKAARRYEALTARSNFVNGIKQAEWDYKTQLANWYTQQSQTLKMNADQYTVADTTPQINSILSGTQQWATNNVPRANQVTTPTLNTNYGQSTYGGGSVVGTYGNYKKLDNGLWVDQYGRQVSDPTQLSTAGDLTGNIG